MAVENVFGATTAWVADIDPGPRKILAHRFPDAPNLGDVTAVDWSKVEPVDILTGGFPCQDVSTAGRRAGMVRGNRSGMWFEFARAIDELRPSLVIIENVRGLLSARTEHSTEIVTYGPRGGRRVGHTNRALGVVLRDLADLGYDAQWHGLRAADVGACHGRFRVFLVAYPQELGHEWSRSTRDGRARPAVGHRQAGGIALLPTPGANLGDNGGPQHPDKRRAGGHSVSIEDAVHGLTIRTPVALLPTPSVADVQGGRKARSGDRSGELLLNGIAHENRWGDYAAATHRHERMLGRPAPSPTEPGRNGNPRLSAKFAEWMMGLPDGWVTDTPGITRNEALKALGNGVVPAQAEAAIRHMLPPAGGAR